MAASQQPREAATPASVTRHLQQVRDGQRDARELLPVLYDELRVLAATRLSHESSSHTLQATALVHEAYLRLLGPDGATLQWDSRGHFFAAAAEAMRRILIDHARARDALKRGGAKADSVESVPRPRRVALTEATLDAALSLDADPAMLIDLDDALTALERAEPAKAQLVKLRFYAGLTLEQAGRALKLSPATADRHWAFSKAWLFARLSGGGPPPAAPNDGAGV